MKQLILATILFVQGASVPGINFFSPQQDIEIGTVSAAEAEKQLSIVRSLPLNEYIRSIGQRLLTASPSRQVRFQFRIVNSDEVRSAAFPNGTIYVYRGLLSLAANDDEVAAILAHEMGHVLSRHATSQLSLQLLLRADDRDAPISLASALPTDGWKEQLSRLGVVFGVESPFLHYRPAQETEAAAVAARLLTIGRFRPGGLDVVLQKAAETTTFLYNHPIAKVANVEGAATRGTLSFRTFRSALVKLPKPAAKEPPATAMATAAIPSVYSHPVSNIKLNYPEGWQLTPINVNGAILAAPNGIRRGTAGDDITLGVMLDVFDLTTADKKLTLEQATNRLIVHLRQRNQTVRAVPGAQTPTLIADQPGLRTVLLRGGLVRSGNTSITEPSEVLWLVTRTYYENLFYMVFVAPEADFPDQQALFEQIIRSVQIP